MPCVGTFLRSTGLSLRRRRCLLLASSARVAGHPNSAVCGAFAATPLSRIFHASSACGSLKNREHKTQESAGPDAYYKYARGRRFRGNAVIAEFSATRPPLDEGEEIGQHQVGIEVGCRTRRDELGVDDLDPGASDLLDVDGAAVVAVFAVHEHEVEQRLARGDL